MKNDIAKNGMAKAGFYSIAPEPQAEVAPPIPNGYPIFVMK
jgi:hypothetical protein